MIHIPILRLDTVADPELAVPRRIRAGDAAADLPARMAVELAPGERMAVPTGFAIALPRGSCALILPRSGLARDHGVTVLNSPGLIDSGYRGEIQVLLHNTSNETARLQRGERIAQLLVLTVEQLAFVEVDQLPDGPDDRGRQGFGSSGRE